MSSISLEAIGRVFRQLEPKVLEYFLLLGEVLSLTRRKKEQLSFSFPLS
jgi:hypothetical protein